MYLLIIRQQQFLFIEDLTQQVLQAEESDLMLINAESAEQ